MSSYPEFPILKGIQVLIKNTGKILNHQNLNR